MEQTMVWVRGSMLSWLDFGGARQLVLALHGSFGRGTVFAPIADRLQGAARVVALDQRGHGLADHRGPFPEPSSADVAAVIDRLGSGPVVVLGHSLGGITAYQLAAQHPELVRALIIEDVGAVMRRRLVERLARFDLPHPAAARLAQHTAVHGDGPPGDSPPPHSQLVAFPDAGHWIHDDDPAGCAEASLSFLSTISSGSR